MRTSSIERNTKETRISISVDLDGTGLTEIHTGMGFFDHMLDAFGRHSLIDLTINAQGDLFVDGHHTVEDCGIVLGQAVAAALGDKRSITRYGHAVVPMDEALIECAIDISGRGGCYWDVDLPFVMLGTFDAQLVEEFMISFAHNAGITLHIRQLAGKNAHHVAEGAFKALARALRQAVEPDPRVTGIPSTKGSL